MFKSLPHSANAPTVDLQRFYFGALTPAMADHLRRRAAENAHRHALDGRHAPKAENGNTPWPPMKDWQD